MSTDELRIIQDGDLRRRVVRASDGFVLGWILKWYKTDQVNRTGIKMFRAEPSGHSVDGIDFDRFQSALGYLDHYWEAR